MLRIPENIKALFLQKNITRETVRQVKLRFYGNPVQLLLPEESLFPSEDLFPMEFEPILELGPAKISQESLAVTQNLCVSETLHFGECNAAMAEVTVADVQMDVTGKEFTLSVEVGGYELMLGIFRVDRLERQADRRMKQIVAYDRMLHFQVDVSNWYQGLVFPMTLKAFRDSLCDHVGIRQMEAALPLDGLMISKTIEPAQLSGLDVMNAICELNGCFGQINVTGRFQYVFLTATSLFPSEELFPMEDLFPAEMEGENIPHYREATYEDFLVYGIDKLIIRQEEGDVGASYGAGTNAYTIQGNFLVFGKSGEELLSIAATTYDQISGKTYRPCRITTAAMPWVEPGDGLLCHTSDDVIETYCLKRRMKGIQAMMDTFEAEGTQERKEDFGIHTQILQLEGKAAVIKRNVEEVSVRVTDLKDYTEAQFKITADQILAEVRRAQDAEAALSVRADQITASVKNLKEETEAQFRITANQISAEVKRAKEAEAALTIKADGISTSVTNLRNDTNSRFEQTAGQITAEVRRAKDAEQSIITQTSAAIALKVSKGEVTGQLNSELKITGNSIDLTTGHFTVSAKNFSVDQQGNAYFAGSITGGSTIDVGALYADNEELVLGDFKITANDQTTFASTGSQYVVLSTDVYSNGTRYGSLTLADRNGKNGTEIIGGVLTNKRVFTDYIESSGRAKAKDIYISGRQDFWDGWSLTNEIILLHNEVFGTDY